MTPMTYQRDARAYRFSLPNEIWGLKLPPTAFSILAYLCYLNSHHKGESMPSVDEIAELLHMSPDMAQKQMDTLIKRDLISPQMVPAFTPKHTGKFSSLPNEIFSLDLGHGAITVYAYLLYCEDRSSHQCHPSYKTISATVGLSVNTVMKHIAKLVDRQFITVVKIEPKQIKVREVFECYADNGDDGVFAYGGRLAIRPPYQREFVYDNEQAEAVIQTVLKGFPLNVMYWVKVGSDRYEVLDGQQRTLSVMQYLKHKFSIALDGRKYYWDALPDDKYNAIMNYEFMVYICEGEESEKLEWFRVVNIAGEKLTEQELRNSVYTGEWLSDAKRYFSKRNCAAKLLADKYITGDPNRQELLEKALRGICEYQSISEITEYMARHKSDADADELWQYFQDVIHWSEKIFPKYFSDMKGLVGLVSSLQ